MKPTVYVETTIVSYPVALPTLDLIQSAYRQITREWWERRGRFDLYVSRAVVAEARRGNPDAAARGWRPFVAFHVSLAADEWSTWQRTLSGAARCPCKLG